MREKTRGHFKTKTSDNISYLWDQYTINYKDNEKTWIMRITMLKILVSIHLFFEIGI